MRQHCNCEWDDKGRVMTLCAAHQHYEGKRCVGFMSDIDRLQAALTTIRDVLPERQDAYARLVFAIAANALEPEAGKLSPSSERGGETA